MGSVCILHLSVMDLKYEKRSFFESRGVFMAAENRKFRRKLVSANVLIHENGNKPVKGSLTNISCGGVGLNSSLLNLHIGSRVIIEVETLRGLPRMQIKGRIQ